MQNARYLLAAPESRTPIATGIDVVDCVRFQGLSRTVMTAGFMAPRALLLLPTRRIVSSNAGLRRPLALQNLPITSALSSIDGNDRIATPCSQAIQRPCPSTYPTRTPRQQQLHQQPLQSSRRQSLAVSYLVTAGVRSFSAALPQPSALTTKLSVTGGTMTVILPLPGLPGLTSVGVPVDAPVRQLVKELKARDESLTDIDVANADGHKLAQSTPVSDDAGRGLLISLGGRPRIRVVNEASGHSMHEAPSPDLYAKLKAKITNAGRVKLKREELDALCTEVCKETGSGYTQAKEVDPMLAEGWLNALVEDGLVFTADKGRVVLLNPSGPGVSDEIANTLRRDDQLMDAKVSVLLDKLDAMAVEERRLQEIEDKLVAKVYRNVRLKKAAVLTFMVAQFGTLAYCVYELYSWDVMEPATYFLMLSYSVGASLYFAANNREASYKNLMDEALKKREAKLKPALGYSRSGHARLKREIRRFEEAVELLRSHRDAHPPVASL